MANGVDLSEQFKAESGSLCSTMIAHGGVMGFRIPEYQRAYDWDRANVRRLLEDCANGFVDLADRPESVTFLGTLILVNEQPERTFRGVSLAVVDGQQRITTLLLLACALASQLKRMYLQTADALNTLGPVIREWLDEEIDFQRNELFRCIAGHVEGPGGPQPFPRLVRHTDNRAIRPSDTEYRSAIARVLSRFVEFHRGARSTEEFSPKAILESVNDPNAKAIVSNYDAMCDLIHQLVGSNAEESDQSLPILNASRFAQRGVKQLFRQLDIMGTDKERQKAIYHACSVQDLQVLLRLALFSSYVTSRVVLTTVESTNEDYAFDIFDALNTTGEPLTALDTFKPRVVRFANDASADLRQMVRDAFEETEQCLRIDSPKAQTWQKDVRDSVRACALYATGEKIGNELSAQRRYLRTTFERLQGPSHKARFVMALREVAAFTDHCWRKEGIARLSWGVTDRVEQELVRLCLRFLSQLNMSLVIPILTRFWPEADKERNWRDFASATRAVTAFVAIRRSSTRGTANIDGDFRAVMGSEGLSIFRFVRGGGDRAQENERMPVSQLKEVLRRFLRSRRLGIDGKGDWIRKVKNAPLAEDAKLVAKFIIMAAADGAEPAPQTPGVLTRQGIARSDQRAYLTYGTWEDEKYATVEHVAPQTPKPEDWDKCIYEDDATRHTVGNLILLPEKANSALGNNPFRVKKLFFQAMASIEISERENLIAQARKQGLRITPRMEALISTGERAHLLDHIVGVEDWTADLIQKRSENILSLAWDRIAPWLDFPHDP